MLNIENGATVHAILRWLDIFEVLGVQVTNQMLRVRVFRHRAYKKYIQFEHFYSRLSVCHLHSQHFICNTWNVRVMKKMSSDYIGYGALCWRKLVDEISSIVLWRRKGWKTSRRDMRVGEGEWNTKKKTKAKANIRWHLFSLSQWLNVECRVKKKREKDRVDMMWHWNCFHHPIARREESGKKYELIQHKAQMCFDESPTFLLSNEQCVRCFSQEISHC